MAKQKVEGLKVDKKQVYINTIRELEDIPYDSHWLHIGVKDTQGYDPGTFFGRLTPGQARKARRLLYKAGFKSVAKIPAARTAAMANSARSYCGLDTFHKWK